jgi:hypothetical protein
LQPTGLVRALERFAWHLARLRLMPKVLQGTGVSPVRQLSTTDA